MHRAGKVKKHLKNSYLFFRLHFLIFCVTNMTNIRSKLRNIKYSIRLFLFFDIFGITAEASVHYQICYVLLKKRKTNKQKTK